MSNKLKKELKTITLEMKRHTLLLLAALVLLCASALLYFIHYLIFGNPHHIFIYLLGDVAFIPIEVLVVAVIVERIINRHDKHKLVGKLNMVIGTFFSELGTRLIGALTEAIENKSELTPYISIDKNWTPTKYREAREFVRTFKPIVNTEALDLAALRDMLTERRDMLVSLLANPNLLEHERFTNLLWALFHLMEELGARDKLTDLPETDAEHLAGDIHRVYARLTQEWLMYCKHLQKAYPYIFSIIARTHPLQERPDATVTLTD